MGRIVDVHFLGHDLKVNKFIYLFFLIQSSMQGPQYRFPHELHYLGSYTI